MIGDSIRPAIPENFTRTGIHASLRGDEACMCCSGKSTCYYVYHDLNTTDPVFACILSRSTGGLKSPVTGGAPVPGVVGAADPADHDPHRLGTSDAGLSVLSVRPRRPGLLPLL